MTSESVAGITTVYTYDNDGLLTQVQLPSGYTMSMTYDQAGRRTGITDNQGGSIVYTLDDNDLPTNTSIYAGNTLHLTANKVFDGLGRLMQAWGANSSEKFQYGYSGYRQSSQTNAVGETQSIYFDKSLVIGEAGQGKNSSIGYDNDDNMTSINAESLQKKWQAKMKRRGICL